MRSMRSVVVLVALLAGCGDNLDLDRCLPTGFADGETMLSGATLGPFARAMQVPATSATLPITYAFVLDEAEGACGEPGASGRRLVIDFCDAPTEAAYAIVPPSQLACPNGAVAVSKKISPALTGRIKRAFLDLGRTAEGKQLLSRMYLIENFAPASSADYDPVREAFNKVGLSLK